MDGKRLKYYTQDFSTSGGSCWTGSLLPPLFLDKRVNGFVALTIGFGGVVNRLVEVQNATAVAIVARPVGQIRSVGIPVAGEVGPVGGHCIRELPIARLPGDGVNRVECAKDVPDLSGVPGTDVAGAGGDAVDLRVGRDRDLPIEGVAIDGSAAGLGVHLD